MEKLTKCYIWRIITKAKMKLLLKEVKIWERKKQYIIK